MGDLSPQPYPMNQEITRRLQVVNNHDDRLELVQKYYPWNQVGRLTTRFPSDSPGSELGHCTGAIIDKDIILSSAHCFYDKGTRTWAYEATFVPTQHFDEQVYGNITERHPQWKLYVPAAYTVESIPGYDYALLKLSRPIHDTMQPMQVVVACDELQRVKRPVPKKKGQTSNLDVSSAGYPGDLPKGQVLKQGRGIYYEFDCQAVISDCIRSNPTMHIDCDADEGQSGSPIWSWRVDSGRLQAYVVGIIAGAVKDKVGPNLAKQFSADDVNRIYTWIRKSG